MLGFEDTYHMVSCATENKSDCDIWLDALLAKYEGIGTFEKKDWDALLGHCQATTDAPGCAFVPELVAAYPEAKVVLNKRDMEKWYNSVLDTVYKAYIASKAMGVDEPRFKMLGKIWEHMFGDDFHKNGKDVWVKHYQMVRDLVPADNLLEFEAKDGWEPLCKFLEVPVPDVPYPRVNDTSNFWERYEKGTGASLEKVNELVAKAGYAERKVCTYAIKPPAQSSPPSFAVEMIASPTPAPLYLPPCIAIDIGYQGSGQEPLV
ncbi:uncharacterized protein GIQ15_01846 [Arthroderma uncinatum]|uniref:uncharacterized protein n=1 Tax=Arthroderma uncinatum TaxID=74035 RepID=UPI00144ADEEF|nr:uncharacterized protein GIQ15_01846 [Arthroderma uncinatum]KAF3492329.1 hypothetical protein GIQ15_01846 [Arthroderma uncinatum]